MMTTKTIVWFRQDLRLHDNPALVAAARDGDVLPIYIVDETNCGKKKLGAASKCWLHESLVQLNSSLQGKLLVLEGDPLTLLLKICKQNNITKVVWNRCYAAWQIKRDKKITTMLHNAGLETETFNASLLWEPWEISKKDGSNYKVFTPFFRACLAFAPPREPLPKPRKLQLITAVSPTAMPQLKAKHNWADAMLQHWQIGEKAAKKKLVGFIKNRLGNYASGRDFPAGDAVSKLSPHLHFGEISPQQIWYAIKELKQDINCKTFLKELGWREFAYSLLFYLPNIASKNINPKFANFAWQKNNKLLRAWQQGKTGYPLVDAGMRELWQTGFMHNRVRMVVASFLIKNLLIDWRQGEAWFWDCLVDADLASNSASWQWVAGCGADAAPFFRIFNPITQSKKFDPEGAYIKQYVPELAHLPKKYLHEPWLAPAELLPADYPAPIVDLQLSREAALRAYHDIQ